MEPKDMNITEMRGAKDHISDLQVCGDGDTLSTKKQIRANCARLNIDTRKTQHQERNLLVVAFFLLSPQERMIPHANANQR